MSDTHRHLDEAERGILRDAEALARDVLAATAAAGTPGRVNRGLVKALADHGLLARVLGGGRVPAVDLCLIREGLARYSTAAETAFALQGLGAHPILVAGRPAAVQRWIPRVAAGDAVAAIALTEPAAGSDLASLSLRADPDGDAFRLTGEKSYISNAPEADVYSVFARTSPSTGARGISAFAVAGDSRGLGGEPTALLGDHPIGRLTFDGVRAGPDDVLGSIGGGFTLAMRTLDVFRPSVGAAAVGMAQAALDAALQHAATRRAFGATLSRLQAVSHPLADVATRVQASRLLVYSAARALDAGGDEVAQASAMAKLHATETAQQAVDVAIQVHGARALEESHPLAHLYREVRSLRIYEGASEVQREVIARRLFAALHRERQ